MNKFLDIAKLEDTAIWNCLNEKAPTLAGNIRQICAEASDRMKAMPTFAPQYTLHDESHLLRLTELMAKLLGEQLLELNTAELALLILTAHFHDQGMVPIRKEYDTLQEDPSFQLQREKWLVEHPNFGEIQKEMGSGFISEIERVRLSKKLAELETAMLTDFFRTTHANRSARFVRKNYDSDKRLEIQSINISPFLAILCESHAFPTAKLTPESGLRLDEQIGTFSVNMPYLAILLRLADILDFDRDRTPEILFKSIHFTNEVSLAEWEKHRSVQGWIISNQLIRFTMRSKHPVYEASARQFMDFIDSELSACHQLCRSQPQEFSRYRLKLPTQVDRSRIEPLNNAYRYHDLEFRLSRDEIVRLLMTDQLYGRPHLCIRELLQNSLDALRYRKALFGSSGIQWTRGHVILCHFVDENGYEIIQCADNGSGMDEDIIANHFVRIGRSFYRSPVFERERTRLRSIGHDFDPCSKFGIGFMSCFMLGDHITIKTRRDYGSGKEWGPPLVIEINGLSSLLVIRDGESDQPVGTTVTITSRKKPSFLDKWTDKVQLTDALKGYALATEFPIIGECNIPEISEKVGIPPNIETTPTILEAAKIKNIITFEQNLTDIDESLNGNARLSFLLDDSGMPSIENNEAKWVGTTEGARKKWDLVLSHEDRHFDYDYDEFSTPVCCDGILVAGTPGRASYRKDVKARLGSYNSTIQFNGTALIDARGELKPELTPGRTPPRHFFDMPPGWKRLNDKFRQALGLLWKNLAVYLAKGLNGDVFWKLTSIYGIWVPCIPHQILWDVVPVCLARPDGEFLWKKICDLRELFLHSNDESGFVLRDSYGFNIRPNMKLGKWESQGNERPNFSWHMNSTVLLMSNIEIHNSQVTLFLRPPSQSIIPLSQHANFSHVGINMFFVDYTGNASDALTLETPYPTANRSHPLVKVNTNAKYLSEKNDLQEFAAAFLPCISETLSSKEKTPSLEEPGYWQKRVAHLYFSVQWDRYDQSLKPPYKVWSMERGWYNFTETDLGKWRDSPAQIK